MAGLHAKKEHAFLTDILSNNMNKIKNMVFNTFFLFLHYDKQLRK
ncbi:MAG: hypothetical protein ACJA1H_000897 [Glaciecola sp.]|jgi:hypothetical protein